MSKEDGATWKNQISDTAQELMWAFRHASRAYGENPTDRNHACVENAARDLRQHIAKIEHDNLELRRTRCTRSERRAGIVPESELAEVSS